MKKRKVNPDGRRWLTPWHFAVFAMGAVAGSILGLATKIWAVQWLFRLSLRLWIPDSDLAMGPIWGQRIVVAVGASAQVS